MGSLLDGKHSQRGNRFLPITEAYLEPSQKSKMQLFGENRTDLQSLLSVKLSDNSKIVTVLCYHNRSTTQRQTEQRSNTNQVFHSNSRNCNFGEALIAFVIGLFYVIHIFHPRNRESLVGFLISRIFCELN